MALHKFELVSISVRGHIALSDERKKSALTFGCRSQLISSLEVAIVELSLIGNEAFIIDFFFSHAWGLCGILLMGRSDGLYWCKSH